MKIEYVFQSIFRFLTLYIQVRPKNLKNHYRWYVFACTSPREHAKDNGVLVFLGLVHPKKHTKDNCF